VLYGTSATDLRFTASSTSLTGEHTVFLPGLQANTKHYYVLTSGEDAADSITITPTYWFRTQPAVGTPGPYRLWAIGDAGTGSYSQTAVRDAYLAYSSVEDTHVFLALGDNAYDTGRAPAPTTCA
jgi:phosphodiesterase/alkaline phosphatase D-like protein